MYDVSNIQFLISSAVSISGILSWNGKTLSFAAAVMITNVHTSAVFLYFEPHFSNCLQLRVKIYHACHQVMKPCCITYFFHKVIIKTIPTTRIIVTTLLYSLIFCITGYRVRSVRYAVLKTKRTLSTNKAVTTCYVDYLSPDLTLIFHSSLPQHVTYLSFDLIRFL